MQNTVQKSEVKLYSAGLQVGEIQSIWVEFSGVPARKEVTVLLGLLQ